MPEIGHKITMKLLSPTDTNAHTSRHKFDHQTSNSFNKRIIMAPLGDIPHASDSASFDLGNESSCVARDEAAELRNVVCQLRVRLEEVEEERNYNAAKANELEDVIQAFKQEYVHEELVRKSLQLAEISMTLDSLQSQIKGMQEEKGQLILARSSDVKKMEELSDVIRSLQCSDDESSSADDEQVVLTPQKALDMTLKNMKAHIEFLEDELQDRAVKCSNQEKKIVQLEKDNEMKDVKIEMLEELFRSLNDDRHHEDEEKQAPHSSSLEKKNTGVTTTRPRVSRRTRPEMGKARSWDNLLGKGRKPDPISDRRERRVNRRSASSRNLNKEETKRSLSPRSSGGERKDSTIVVGDQEGVYAGPFMAGKPNGVGTVRFSNGDTYLGEVKDGKLHGKGTLYSKSGVSRGSFKDNVFLG